MFFQEANRRHERENAIWNCSYRRFKAVIKCYGLWISQTPQKWVPEQALRRIYVWCHNNPKSHVWNLIEWKSGNISFELPEKTWTFRIYGTATKSVISRDSARTYFWSSGGSKPCQMENQQIVVPEWKKKYSDISDTLKRGSDINSKAFPVRIAPIATDKPVDSWI